MPRRWCVNACLHPSPAALGQRQGLVVRATGEGACQGPSPRDLGLGPAPSPEELQLGKVLVLRSLRALPAGTKGRWIRAGRAVQRDPGLCPEGIYMDGALNCWSSSAPGKLWFHHPAPRRKRPTMASLSCASALGRNPSLISEQQE